MKRSSEFDDGRGGRPKKRSAGGQTTVVLPCVLKFLAPEALASAIIGKGGGVIAQLRSSTGTKIGLTDHDEFFPDTDCRVVTVQGQTPESLDQLMKQIIVKINECAKVTPSDSLGQPGDLKLRTAVPRAAVGGIIGKGGSAIRQLRDASGAKISAGEPVGSGPGADQLVTISGREEGLEYVIAEVNKQVQMINSEGWFTSWASNPGVFPNPGYGSTGGSGRSRSGGPSLREETPRSYGGGYSGGGGGGGYGGGTSGAGYAGASSGYGGNGTSGTASYRTSSAPPSGARPGIEDPAGMGLMMQVARGLPPYVMQDERGFALSCVVPNRLVGGIIGRGGAGTKEVQSLTGTKIGIREITGDPDNRSMNIAGPLTNTCAAYMLMMKRYLDSEQQLDSGPAAKK